MSYVLITGSGGLIGSEAVSYFCKKGFDVVGIDNDMRSYFFGDNASTIWRTNELIEKFNHSYVHFNVDIRNSEDIEKIFKDYEFDLIIHSAAQPSHDWAAKEPYTDFSVNANGTLVLLENFRLYAPTAVFIFTSTNKVYGDTPNKLPLIELETRYEIDNNHKYYRGIDESMSIDNCKHSLFGVSKVASDIMVQEYGKYFGLKTAVFRGGCLTGPSHSGAELHGFLSYLVKCIVSGQEYTIYGYKGKQVRDNIHSYDFVNAIYHVYKNPKSNGEVYNMGGSRFSNISMKEAISKIEKLVNKKAVIKYIDKNRIGDHTWYISDVSKFKEHYPGWNFKYNIDDILTDICKAELNKYSNKS